MIDIIRRIAVHEKDPTAIEYGIVAALVATAGVASFLVMGSSLETFFTGAASLEGITLIHADGGGLRG
ncbi:MAG: Flp family type IVb pilin [Alphaproteobacteria bacterium]|nr:Flp family type IVb pilin [Alphaproteobacteria bacterium]